MGKLKKTKKEEKRKGKRRGGITRAELEGAVVFQRTFTAGQQVRWVVPTT